MKKRKKYRKTAPYRQRKSKRGNNISPTASALKNELLGLLFESDRPQTIQDISGRIKNPLFTRKDLSQTLTRLIGEKIVQKSGKKGFALSKAHNLVTGVIDMNPKGFGYLTNIGDSAPRAPFPTITRDGFISAGRMGGARHSDRVLAQVTDIRRDNRLNMRVVKVLDRKSDRLAGILKKDRSGFYVQPEDPRYPIVRLPGENKADAHLGKYVITTLSQKKIDSTVPAGKITEVLGSPDSVDVQMRLVIERYHLPFQFSKKVIQECASLPTIEKEAEQDSSRMDLRHIPFVTIDGESAKDFDDAVAVEQIGKGFRLYVAIADVSAFVRPGSQLDKEAYERGTSIYFPGRVIPMLPEKLSNDLCSLVPEKDRLTFTAILDFDGSGNRLKKKFSRSIICSHRRLTYQTVQKILIDGDEELLKTHETLLPSLESAAKLATLLKKKREQRGSIHFTIPEPEILLAKGGTIKSINRAERFFAHELIEEFMLAANEAVAATFTERSLPTLYRVHEQPDSEKVNEFISFVSTIGLHLPAYDTSADWYNQALDSVKGSPKEYIVNNLLLRTMQQARYDHANIGHFGLAAIDYCHFTSPIRRYPDLVVHRNLLELISAPPDKVKKSKAKKSDETASHLSTRERVAVKAERDMNDRLKLQFMKNHIGESFDGIISGVNNFAFFVELIDLFISGSVALSSLTDDYYFYEPDRHRLIGELSHNVFQIGDLLRVTVIDVDDTRGRINFLPENYTV